MFETIERLAAVPGVSTAGALARRKTQLAALDELLPVAPELAGLLPHGGLRRGSTVSVVGSPSLLLALLAEATATGSWAAIVGMPDIGVVAAHELGVAVERLALVRDPGAELGPVVSALLDGVDVVVVGAAVADRMARRLSAKARAAKSVLISAGRWPGVEVELRCETDGWRGAGDGHGVLSEREATVHAVGRAAAARPVRTRLLLPGPNGTVQSPALAAAEPSVPSAALSSATRPPTARPSAARPKAAAR